jgi:uncharacterized protein (DUF433 family)
VTPQQLDALRVFRATGELPISKDWLKVEGWWFEAGTLPHKLTPAALAFLEMADQLAEEKAAHAKTKADLDEAQDEAKAADLHRNLNRKIADALGLLKMRIDPETGEEYLPSWHDMPEKVAKLIAQQQDFVRRVSDLQRERAALLGELSDRGIACSEILKCNERLAVDLELCKADMKELSLTLVADHKPTRRRIICDADTCSGRPRIEGARLYLLALAGMTREQVAVGWPDLNLTDEEWAAVTAWLASPEGLRADRDERDSKGMPDLLSWPPNRVHAAVNAERIRLGLSWRDLARALDLAPSGLTRWGQGKMLSASAYLKVLGWLRTAMIAANKARKDA